MGQNRMDPQKQFSKRLARWTSLFWFVYMAWLSVLMLLQPQAALFSVYMGIIVTIVMIINVWAYTKNSIYEKSVLALIDKTKLEIGLKNTPGKGDDGDEEDSVTEEEGGNG